MAHAGEQEQRLERALSDMAIPPGVRLSAFAVTDFPAIQALSLAEGWSTPTDRPEQCRQAWVSSWPALVARDLDGAVIGFLRALTDGEVTTYIGEILVAPGYRRGRLGAALVEACQRLCPRTRLDLLSTEDADLFYRGIGCREFTGFRLSPVADG